MAEDLQTQEAGEVKRKRRLGHKKGSKARKKMKGFLDSEKKVKMDGKMKKFFRRKVRDYNSDDEDDESSHLNQGENKSSDDTKHEHHGKSSDEEGEDHGVRGEENDVSEDEDGDIQPGITKLMEGCKAFRMAFKKITKKSVSDDVLGPVLSAHKKLVVAKLAEEEAERKNKGEAKKEKHLVREKGHVKPANFLDSHEKFLIGVATKGVVKLFNAVNKAQNAQKGINPSRSKDAKALRKRRKETFFSELGKTSSQSTNTSAKIPTSTIQTDGEGPAWAPLRDNYMLTSSKLKNWDKMPDTTAGEDFGMPADTSSDDD